MWTLYVSSCAYLICMAHKRLKDAATRCILRPIDASKCVCGQLSAAYSASPVPLAGFGEELEREMAMEGKGMEWERKRRESKERGNRIGREFASLALGGIDAPEHTIYITPL